MTIKDVYEWLGMDQDTQIPEEVQAEVLALVKNVTVDDLENSDLGAHVWTLMYGASSDLPEKILDGLMQDGFYQVEQSMQILANTVKWLKCDDKYRRLLDAYEQFRNLLDEIYDDDEE